VGDLIWAAADSRSRGFLLGATAGRTTLAGEGLQHQDGCSQLLASTIPNCRSYDPCFAFEIAAILEDGMKAMLERQEDAFYYITLMNENYAHRAFSEEAREGVLKGMHQVHTSGEAQVRLFGSGTILMEALAAAELLAQDWDVTADVWSVTSYSQLRWEALAADRERRLNLRTNQPWVEQCLGSSNVPVIAATDYVRAVPDLIRPWIRSRYITLGTDGFGRSDTRAALRRFFEVDREGIAVAALHALEEKGAVHSGTLAKALDRYGISGSSRAPWLL
jgi:pyruvate dehydrogenase E1 component